MPDRTPNQTTPDHDRTTIAEAAKRLGVSTDAVRKRLNRGQLDGEKVGGVWVVFLPAETSQTTHGEYFDRNRPEADRTGPDARDRLIAALEDDVQFLRRQVEDAEQRHAAEVERRDVLLREALGRLPALPAVTSRAEPQEIPLDAPGEESAANRGADASQSAQGQRPLWWKVWKR